MTFDERQIDIVYRTIRFNVATVPSKSMNCPFIVFVGVYESVTYIWNIITYMLLWFLSSMVKLCSQEKFLSEKEDIPRNIFLVTSIFAVEKNLTCDCMLS